MIYANNQIEYVREKLSQEELLCLLAEEASELAKAALKLRRVYDGTNPTPIKRSEAFDNLLEEIADVRLVLVALGLNRIGNGLEYERIMQTKLRRWVDRLKAKQPLRWDD